MSSALKQAIDADVQKGIEERSAFRAEGHTCPVCLGDGMQPMGGPGCYWIEHGCGAYSKLKPTLAEALASEWGMIDDDVNACMYPPVGG